MRLFLAIKLPERTVNTITKAIEPIRRDHADARWVPTQNYHITLAFLGESWEPEEVIPRVERAVYDIPSFRMSTLTGGVFIDDKLTYYVDFYRAKPLETLVDALFRELAIEKKYKFIPHVTVAKAKVPSKQQYMHIKRKWEQTEIEHDFDVTQIGLYESILTNQAPVYREVALFDLPDS
jgi:2'-5' RNA ligase